MMIRPFLNLLGGPKAIADSVNAMGGHPLKPKAVSQWGYEGTIPHRWRQHLAKLAKQMKFKERDVPDEIRSFMQ